MELINAFRNPEHTLAQGVPDHAKNENQRNALNGNLYKRCVLISKKRRCGVDYFSLS